MVGGMNTQRIRQRRTRRFASYRASLPEIQRHACESIEDHIYWHIGGVSAISKRTGFPDVGTVIAVRWIDRTFLLTAGHVVDGYADDELRFVFRPPGPLQRDHWWQSSSSEGQMFRAEPLNIVRRYRSNSDDIAALEVKMTLEPNKAPRFYELSPNSKIIRPINSSICAIGLPFDSFEHLAPGAAALTMFALWGNIARSGKSKLEGFSPRKNLLMEFLPADQGREPGGFSGAGTWYQTPSTKPPIVWSPAPILSRLST
jgi:hypothetical protein